MIQEKKLHELDINAYEMFEKREKDFGITASSWILPLAR